MDNPNQPAASIPSVSAKFVSPIDQAIAACDRILGNIDSIERDLRASLDATQAALDDAIARLGRRA